MPEQLHAPALEDDLMYSPPPPPHTPRWYGKRALALFGRLLLGALICILALLMFLLFFLLMGYRHVGFLHYWHWFI